MKTFPKLIFQNLFIRNFGKLKNIFIGVEITPKISCPNSDIAQLRLLTPHKKLESFSMSILFLVFVSNSFVRILISLELISDRKENLVHWFLFPMEWQFQLFCSFSSLLISLPNFPVQTSILYNFTEWATLDNINLIYFLL